MRLCVSYGYATGTMTTNWHTADTNTRDLFNFNNAAALGIVATTEKLLFVFA